MYWSATVCSSFKVGEREHLTRPVNVITDSGTSALIVPRKVYISTLRRMGNSVRKSAFWIRSL